MTTSTTTTVPAPRRPWDDVFFDPYDGPPPYAETTARTGTGG